MIRYGPYVSRVENIATACASSTTGRCFTDRPFTDARQASRVLLFVLVTAAAVCAADSPFAGSWKLNPAKSAFTGTTIAFEQAAGGGMKMTADGQSYTFKVDGKSYPAFMGHAATWTQVDPSTWQAAYTKPDTGLALYTQVLVLGPDGKTLTATYKGSKPSGEAFEDSTVFQRVAGTSGLPGTWKSSKVQINSPDMLQITAGKDDGLVFTIPAYNMTADVKFDGKDYVVSGPTVPAGFTMGLRRIDARSFEMIQKVGGKVVYRDTMTVSADGKTLTDVGVAEGTQEKTKAVYDRQ